MPATGKSFVGKKWAAILNYNFFDVDKIICQQENLSVAQIFEQKGEDYFREQEAFWLRKLSTEKNFVISTGGGTACFYDNMQWMNEVGITIWFNDEIENIYNRIIAETNTRPLYKNLNNQQLFEQLQQQLQERKPFYSKAKYIIESNINKREWFENFCIVHQNYSST